MRRYESTDKRLVGGKRGVSKRERERREERGRKKTRSWKEKGQGREGHNNTEAPTHPPTHLPAGSALPWAVRPGPESPPMPRGRWVGGWVGG